MAFGPAGRRVVVEEGLTGVECSLLALCDGSRVVPLAPARDFKRVGDGDTGPNTGGMGAYSGLVEIDDRTVQSLLEVAVEPLVAALRAAGIEYRGVLYAGLMLTPEGPRVLEYNVRFGDPETQVVLPRLASDPVGLLRGVAEGRLSEFPASSRTPRSVWCWPRRGTRDHIAPGTSSPASVPTGSWPSQCRAPPSSTPERPGTALGGSSPPAGGCSG